MAQLNIQDKREKIDIVVDGNNVATAAYNPTDPLVYKRLIEIYELIQNRPNDKELDYTEEEIETLQGELQDVEDTEKVNAAFQRMNGAIQSFMGQIDVITKNVDAIFGDGICEILLRYGTEGEYLSALLSMAFEKVNADRSKIKGKYKAKQESGVIE